jgi:hypothetical protein
MVAMVRAGARCHRILSGTWGTQMQNRLAATGLFVLVALAAFPAVGTSVVPPAVAPGPEAALEQVRERKVAAYRDVLAQFDAAMRAAPDEPSVAVAKCEFIGQFTDDGYGEWVASAADDLARCTASLHARWPDAPAARLHALEQLWGEEAATLGEQLLPTAGSWPPAYRARLMAHLAGVLGDERKARAGDLALQATRLGDSSQAALAVEHLASVGQHREAAAVLAAAPVAAEGWRAAERVEAAMALADGRIALREMQRHEAAGVEVDAALAARVYLGVGDVTRADRALRSAGPDARFREVRFDVALAKRDMAAAAATIDITDTADFAASMQRFALLAAASPGTLVSGPMLGAMFGAVLLLVFMAIFPGLLLVPVHYRGLVLRVRGRAPAPLFDVVGLRHAWWGGALALCLPMLVAGVIEPRSLATLLGGEALPAPQALFRITLWSAVAGLTLLSPVVARMGPRIVIGDRATLRASWRVPVAWAILFCISALVAWVNSTLGDTSTAQTKMVDAMASVGRDMHGPAMTLLLMAVLAPVFEELVFRGLLLGGMARHVGFAWANFAQAILFAAIHDDPPRFVFYFAMGMLGGWLVRRTGALGPAIALHAANNALAVWLRML